MNIKRLVLGTAAGALAVTGAQAADLPVVVEPVDYVRICDAAGTGFFFIPGTETCMQIRSRVRTDYNLYFNFDDDSVVDFAGGLNGFYDGDTEDRLYRFRARGYVRTSTVTQTEFGQLTTFVDIFVTADSRGRGAGDPGMSVELDSALIQLGGLILGRFATTFGGSQGIYVIEQTFDLGNNTGQINQIAYQFDFGNGFGAQVSLEDNLAHARGIAATENQNFTAGRITASGADYGGNQIPDIVAKVFIDQGWGSAHLSGAGHYINARATYVDPGRGSFTVTDEEYGFAVAAGVEVNIPFGNGTRIGVQGGYAYGAQDYINDGVSSIADSRAVGFVGNTAPDAYFDEDGDLEVGNFFSVAGGAATSFTPTIGAAIGAGYVYNDYDDGDIQNINVQGNVSWTPVSGLLFLLGAEWRYADVDLPFNSSDGSALTTFLRAQAEF